MISKLELNSKELQGSRFSYLGVFPVLETACEMSQIKVGDVSIRSSAPAKFSIAFRQAREWNDSCRSSKAWRLSSTVHDQVPGFISDARLLSRSPNKLIKLCKRNSSVLMIHEALKQGVLSTQWQQADRLAQPAGLLTVYQPGWMWRQAWMLLKVFPPVDLVDEYHLVLYGSV